MAETSSSDSVVDALRGLGQSGSKRPDKAPEASVDDEADQEQTLSADDALFKAAQSASDRRDAADALRSLTPADDAAEDATLDQVDQQMMDQAEAPTISPDQQEQVESPTLASPLQSSAKPSGGAPQHDAVDIDQDEELTLKQPDAQGSTVVIGQSSLDDESADEAPTLKTSSPSPQRSKPAPKPTVKPAAPSRGPSVAVSSAPSPSRRIQRRAPVGGKVLVIGVLFGLSAALLIPAVWSIGIFAGWDVPMADRGSRARTMAMLMLVCWPIVVLSLGSAVWMIRDLMRSGSQ